MVSLLYKLRLMVDLLEIQHYLLCKEDQNLKSYKQLVDHQEMIQMMMNLRENWRSLRIWILLMQSVPGGNFKNCFFYALNSFGLCFFIELHSLVFYILCYIWFLPILILSTSHKKDPICNEYLKWTASQFDSFPYYVFFMY